MTRRRRLFVVLSWLISLSLSLHSTLSTPLTHSLTHSTCVQASVAIWNGLHTIMHLSEAEGGHFLLGSVSNT